MVNAPLHGVLRHLRSMRDTQAFSETADAQLLERFARAREEAAFAALVERHGPMVWSVSRRVLPQVQDAEDVFQATFLLLARKAASIRKAGSVSSWLHGVAHRLALKARLTQARRQSREKRAADMRQHRPSGDTYWSEVQAVLDAALAELPEKYRATLVLCYLEGKTHEEAARYLGCPLGTVRSRVARGRNLLRARLAKHGLSLSAGGLASLLIANSAPAAVPAVLMRSAIQTGLSFAAGQPVVGLCSRQAAGLVTGALRAMVLSKVKIVTVLALVGGLAAGAAALTGRVTGADEAAKKVAVANPKPRADAKPQAADEESIVYAGQVLAADGKPVAGAKLYLALGWGDIQHPHASPERALTGAEGRFQFSVRQAQFGNQYTVVAAAAATHGIGWTDVPAGESTRALTIRLSDGDVPITGQIVDLEGKPIPGVTLQVIEVGAPANGDLGPLLQAAKSKKAENLDLQNQYLPKRTFVWTPKLTTDAAGRFRLTGVGRERLVTARLDGPSIVSQILYILTREGATIEVTHIKGEPEYGRPPALTSYYGASFRYAAAPAKPIVGVVRDKDTKKPLRGITVRTQMVRPANAAVFPSAAVQTATDSQGRYRLTGMPKGKGNRIIAMPDSDMPYVPSAMEVADSPGLDAVTADIELKRAVWIEGKVTDKATGKPLQANVEYYSMYTNPHLRDYPGFVASVLFRTVATKTDGSYRIAGLPGPGLVAVMHKEHYIGISVRGDEFGCRQASVNTAPFAIGIPDNYAALAPVDPTPGAKSVQRDVTLDPGRKSTGKVLGPDGKALAGAHAFGLHGATWWSAQVMKTAEFTMSYDPRLPRVLLFVHVEKGLVGTAQTPKEDGGPVTVQMKPGTVVTGRLVDADRQPRAGVVLQVEFSPKGDGNTLPYPTQPIQTDAQGRFRIDALAPGYKYYLLDGKGHLSLGRLLASGQTLDKGDVQLKPDE
jgi:RNA polymerase sigma factor (sigma-70 family)